jgi:hypothetical protein
LERDAQAQQLRGRIGDVGRGLQRAPQVGLVKVQPVKPPALLRPGQVGGRKFSDRQVVGAMSRIRDRLLVAAGFGEPLGRELPDRLQQPVAQRVRGRLGPDQALVHKRAEQVGDVEHVQVILAADRFGGVQVEGAGEHRQAPQEHLLDRVEQ